MKLVAYADLGRLAYGVAAAISLELKKAIETQGRATLCVAGGTTPAPMFDILAGASIDWAKVTIIPTDERWVDDTDARSNAALVKRHLLVGNAKAAQYIGLYTAGQTPDTAVENLTALIAPHLPITVLLAGMGADLHTASLFPDAENIAAAMANDAPQIMVMQPKSQPEARLTLTAQVLRGAAHSHIMISGQEKRSALESIGSALPVKAPVSVLLDRANVHWAA